MNSKQNLAIFSAATDSEHKIIQILHRKGQNKIWTELTSLGQEPTFKGLLHCFSTCIEIVGNNWYCFNLKNVENCKEKFRRVKKL